jgi:non-specific serine/threonine protein kinase
MSESTTTLSAAARAAAPSAIDAANALPMGHRLHEFELRSVIGVGGFGIVYRAFDLTLEREVAIKEYMPSALAGRSGRRQVSLLSASHSQDFALGLASFVNEAKLLARFDHPSLVKVHRFWEDNGTAYMVMPLYRGTTLRQMRQDSDAAPDEAWLRRLLDHLLGALEVMHREGVFHRDIAPDNILVAGDSPPVLLDFGAARRVISDRSQTLTAILKPSYAPLEQYAESTGMRQGPWTDFYALGATLHFMITGKPPLPATARALADDQPRLAGSGQSGVSDLLLQVCDWMLAPRPQDRPQHVAELRAALAGRLPVPQRARPVEADAWQTTAVQGAAERGRSRFGPSELPIPQAQAARRNNSRTIWVAAVGMVMMAAAGAWWAQAQSASDPHPPEVTRTPPATEGSTADTEPAPQVAASPAAVARVGDAPTASTARGPSSSARSTEHRPVAAKPLHPKADGAAPGHPPAPPAADPPAAEPMQQPVTVAVVTRNPREQCAGRHLLAMHRCLMRECAKPEFQAHRECQKARDIDARGRSLGDL